MSEDGNQDRLDETMDPDRWVDEHADVLFRYAISRIRDAAIAEDLIQETFLAALAARNNFRGASSIRTWLTGILRRKIADYLRRKNQELEKRGQIARPDDYRDDFHTQWKGDPARAYEDSEFWRVFSECTSKLPPIMADAFFMREISQIPFREICELLNITASNLGLRIFRARRALRECLDRNWFNADP